MYKTVLAAMSVFCLLLQGMALGQRPVVSAGSIEEVLECSGRVTDESGSPVAGAQVVVYEPSRRFLSGTDETKAIALTASNADGGFLVSVDSKNADGVRMSYAIVIVTKKGFAPVGEYRDLSKGIGKAFTLIKASTLSGIVVDSRGAPIPEAKVTVSPKVRNAGGSRYNSTIAGAMGLFTVATDAQGRFGFANIPVAALTHVKAEAQGYCEDSPMIWAIGKGFETGTSDIRIVLKRPAIVAGKVVDEKTSEPVAEASVVLLTVGDRYYGNESAKAVTDKDGSFRIECAPGNYAAMVVTDRRVADALYAVPVKVEGQEGVTVNIVLALTKGEPVEVSVADAMAGGPLSDCRVVLRAALRETGFLQRFGVTDAAGKATVWAAPGKYQVEVSKQDYYVRGDRQIVDVEKGKTVRLAIEMLNQSVVEVKGVVADYLDEAVADAEISMCYHRRYPRPDDPSGEIFVLNTCKSGDDGSFSMFVDRQIDKSRQQISSGTIIATKDGYARLTMHVRGFYSDSMKLKLEESRTVAGTVVDTQGRPISGARADLQQMWGAAVSNSILPENMQFTALTDKDGRFVINAVGEPWIVKVDITAEGFLRTGRTETEDRQRGGFRFTDDCADSQIALTRVSYLSGRVIDKKTGQPLPDVRLQIRGGRYGRWNNCKTDEKGEFSLQCTPGKYDIQLNQSLTKVLFAEAVKVTVEEGRSVAVQLEAESSFEVEVRVLNVVTGEPIKDIEIGMQPVDGGARPSAKTDEDGVASYQLAPLEYRPYLHKAPTYLKVGYNNQMEVLRSDQKQRFEIQLLPRSWYWGVVQDKDGNPISGAEVCVLPAAETAAGTNERGEFLLQIAGDLDRPWNKISSSNERKPTIFVRHRELNVVGARRSTERNRIIKITVEPAITVCASVAALDGGRIDDPLVEIRPGTGHYGTLHFRPTPDMQGQFEIPLLPHLAEYHRHDMTVSADGYGSKTVSAELRNSMDAEGRLNFGKIELSAKNLSLQGTVYNTRGEPLENVTVELDRGDRQTYEPVVTDASGVFRFENLPPGRVILRPESDFYAGDGARVEAGDQDAVLIMIPPRKLITKQEQQKLIKAGKLALTVNWPDPPYGVVDTEEQKTVRPAEMQAGMGMLKIVVKDARTNKPVPQCNSQITNHRSFQTVWLRMDDSGVGTMVVPPGTYTVHNVQGSARHLLYNREHEIELVAGQIETIHVSLMTMPLVQAKIYYEDGRLVPEVNLALKPTDFRGLIKIRPGHYRFGWDCWATGNELYPQWLIAKHPRQSLVGVAEITGDTDALDVILERTVTLNGVVPKESAQDNPMARPSFGQVAVKVDVYDPSGKHKIHEQMARCNDDGSYVVEGLPARCNYRIYVERSYPRPIFQVKAEQTLPGATLELDATVFQSPDLSVSGTVVTEEGHVPEYCTITVVGDSQPHRRISLRRESDFTITGLEEGPLELEVTVPKTYIAENPQTGGVRRFSRGSEDFRTRVRTFAGATDVRIVVKEERIAVDPEEIERMWAEDEQEFQQNDKRTISELRMN